VNDATEAALVSAGVRLIAGLIEGRTGRPLNTLTDEEVLEQLRAVEIADTDATIAAGQAAGRASRATPTPTPSTDAAAGTPDESGGVVDEDDGA
jgi:hypothetical protein